jgi:lipopolysaccharide transport system ATP-binding protein
MNEIAISARGLAKRYTLGTAEQHDSLRDLITGGVRSIFRRKRDEGETTFWALQDATFDIRRGENVGIIGLNGAGKSTLLKTLSRIIEPTRGSATVHGRVGALLEVGTGFHWELTGRENVYLYGSILGMRKQEIDRKFDAIVEFAEIGKFIDTPVKRYSSGMYVRLAFSVAAQLEPEILLLDEVLSVGDVAFQRKCMDYAKSLQRSDSTILFVSHNMFTIKTMCTRAIYLKKGRVEFDGAIDKGIEIYERDCRLTSAGAAEGSSDSWPIVINECTLADERGTVKTVFDHGEPMTVRLRYEAREQLDNPNFIVAFIRSDEVAACNFSTEADGVVTGRINGKGEIEFRTPPLKLVSEMYKVVVLVREKGFQKILCAQIGTTFHIRHPLYDTHFGVFHEPAQWTKVAAP